MQRVFDLHLYFLQHSQSETLQKHIFSALRQFIRKVSAISQEHYTMSTKTKICSFRSFLLQINMYCWLGTLHHSYKKKLYIQSFKKIYQKSKYRGLGTLQHSYRNTYFHLYFIRLMSDIGQGHYTTATKNLYIQSFKNISRKGLRHHRELMTS